MVKLYFLLLEAPIIRNMSMMFSAFFLMISLSVSLKLPGAAIFLLFLLGLGKRKGTG